MREALAGALGVIDARLPLRVPVWIGDDRREGDELVSTDPGAPERVVAVAAARPPPRPTRRWPRRGGRSRPGRGRRRPSARRLLVAAAAWMRERRGELAALEVRECAKPWPEADADVCEAIDFLEFYARGAVALDEGRPLFQVPGERNAMRYVPRGVVAVISPWNFPIAIPCGMVAAGLATGNTVVLKPAEQSPACGLMVVQALRGAGVPPGAISLLPGDGEAGAALVRHPDVATIAFTGSGPVGLEILRVAGEVAPGQRHLKRVVAEMGGKNCVIVDSDADLDEAVPALVASAFVYAGQKCSAASRVLVHEAIADPLLERLAGAVERARRRPRRHVRHRRPAGDRARRAGARRPLPRAGRPDRAPGARCATRACRTTAGTARRRSPPTCRADSPVLHEEIFGPLLAVEAVRDVDDACDRVDELPFALTGGLFARNPRTVERVVRRSPVGNLYVNRPITGAMVGRQPFGGNRLSGTGTKAGGPDYLLHFVEPQVVTENTVRHGLVV